MLATLGYTWRASPASAVSGLPRSHGLLRGLGAPAGLSQTDLQTRCRVNIGPQLIFGVPSHAALSTGAMLPWELRSLLDVTLRTGLVTSATVGKASFSGFMPVTHRVLVYCKLQPGQQSNKRGTCCMHQSTRRSSTPDDLTVRCTCSVYSLAMPEAPCRALLWEAQVSRKHGQSCTMQYPSCKTS